MEQKLRELLKKMEIDKSICEILYKANEETVTQTKYSRVCKAAAAQIDLYIVELKKILNERNSVDEGEKSFTTCSWCKSADKCFKNKKCYINDGE